MAKYDRFNQLYAKSYYTQSSCNCFILRIKKKKKYIYIYIYIYCGGIGLKRLERPIRKGFGLNDP